MQRTRRRQPPAGTPPPLRFLRIESPFISMRSEEHTSELQSHRELAAFPTLRSSDLVREVFGLGQGKRSGAKRRQATTSKERGAGKGTVVPFPAQQCREPGGVSRRPGHLLRSVSFASSRPSFR